MCVYKYEKEHTLDGNFEFDECRNTNISSAHIMLSPSCKGNFTCAVMHITSESVEGGPSV